MHIHALHISLANQALQIEQWHCQQLSWCLIGNNHSHKELLFRALTQDIPYSGEISECPDRVATVSFDEQQALVEREIERDNSDLIDSIDLGTSVFDMLAEIEPDAALCIELARELGLDQHLQQGFRSLSTGETRKLILARALLKQPELLLLHDPYAGLDQKSRKQIDQLLQALVVEKSRPVQILLMVDRVTDAPEWFEHIALFSQGKLVQTGHRTQVTRSPQWLALTLTQATAPIPNQISSAPLAIDEPIIELRRAKVNYGDNVVFSQLNWKVDQGEHWRIMGPNGSGKSTLLKLICGDHPQCYSNWIRQFGIQRGSGESIWDIKRHIGMVSAELQLNYRVRTNCLTVVVSGYFDSIGVYEAVSKTQQSHATAWLHWFHLGHLSNQPFHSLSYGEQRLILIIRALVKRPHLLILDEPLQGLDDSNALLVISAINRIVEAGISQLLYVSHRDEPNLHTDFKVLALGNKLDEKADANV